MIKANQAVVPAGKVMSGTYGTVVVDGHQVASIKNAQAKVEYRWENVSQCGALTEGRKLGGMKITYSYSYNRVYSHGADYAEKAKQGDAPEVTIIIGLDDPAAYGAERVALYGCTLDATVLADFAAGKPSEATVSGEAMDFEYLDRVEER